MIYWDKLEELFKTKTGLGYWNGSRNQLIGRCPYCEPDSKKNHGHLYLYMNNEGEIPTFHCFRCGEDEGHGTIFKLLKNGFGVSPNDYMSKEALKFKMPGSGFDYYKKNFEVSNYNFVKPKNDYKLKRQYLYGRLGFDFDLEKLPGLVLNVKEFVQENNINLGKYERFLDFFEDSFVGFISTYGNNFILRNIDSSSNFRYFKIQIKDEHFFKDFYGIKTGQISKENTIVLSEGVFDLLVSILDDELEEIKNNSIYWASILGSGFIKTIPSVLNHNKITTAHFVILSDSEKSLNKYTFFKKDPAVKSLTVCYNKTGEDFGVKPINIVKKLL